jgi:hypothetical protein
MGSPGLPLLELEDEDDEEDVSPPPLLELPPALGVGGHAHNVIRTHPANTFCTPRTQTSSE